MVIIMKETNTEKNMPVGFVFKMAMDSKALDYYSTLSNSTKERITNYIQNSSTGNESKQRIEDVINNLKNNNLDFL